jgi:formate dehydrogenase major subunit
LVWRDSSIGGRGRLDDAGVDRGGGDDVAFGRRRRRVLLGWCVWRRRRRALRIARSDLRDLRGSGGARRDVGDGDDRAERCEEADDYLAFIADPANSPEAMAEATGIDPEELRAAARLFGAGPNSAIYYGLGVTEHSQGSTMVMGMANLAMVTGNIGREGVGVNPLRGQNNVQGSCDMGSFPHELPGYRHISEAATRALFESEWSTKLVDEPGLRIPNMFEAALDGSFKGMYVQGEDLVQSDPNTQHVAAAFEALECLVVQDIFLNETAKYAHVLLPGSSFLEKNGTFTNAERRISPVRTNPKRWG